MGNLDDIWDKLSLEFQNSKKDQCREKGKRGSHQCKIQLSDLNHLIFDGDQIIQQHSKKSCDCIIFIDYDHVYICIVELKSRNINAHDIQQKFIDTIERINRDCKSLSTLQIIPKFLLLYQNIPSINYQQILPLRFKLFNQSSGLILKKCGYLLKKILK